jgi:hypothetical protein
MKKQMNIHIMQISFFVQLKKEKERQLVYQVIYHLAKKKKKKKKS